MQNIAERFAALFAGRTDVGGVFDPSTNKTYTSKDPVTVETYREHLNGTRSLGVFPLRDDGTVSWLAFDIDNGDFEVARRLRGALSEYGLQSWIERSKGKGYHVWTFFKQPTQATSVRRFAHTVIEQAQAGALEIFPKQGRVSTGGVGNFINLPYFGHASDRRTMITDDGAPIELLAFIGAVSPGALPDRFQRESDEQQTASEKPGPSTIIIGFGDRPADYDGPPPTCVINAMHSDAAEGQRHATGTRLVGYWRNFVGLSDDETWQKLTEWNDQLSDPLSEKRLRETLDRNDRYSWGCSKIREVQAFNDGCSWQACGLYKPVEGEEPPPESLNVVGEAQPEPPTFEDERVICDLLATGWIGDFVEYARRQTDAPRIFHLVTGMSVIAATLGNRCAIPTFGNKRTYPNLYFAVICPSGFYRKSTSADMGMSILRRVNPNLVLPDAVTPERMVELMAEQNDKILHVDEFGAFLHQLNSREYMRDLKAFLTTIFDNKPYTRSIKGPKGTGQTFEINNGALTLLGTTTVDWLQKTLLREDLRAGFTARVLWVMGEHKEPRLKERVFDQEPIVTALADRLLALGMHAEITADFSLVDDRFFEWIAQFEDRYNDNLPPELSGVISRGGTFVQKVAVILAASESGPNENGFLAVRPTHLERAITFVEWCIARQEHIVTEIIQFTEFERLRGRALDIIKSRGGRVPAHEFLKRIALLGRGSSDLVTTLRDSGLIRIVTPVDVKGPGRRARILAFPNMVLPNEVDCT